MKYTQSILSGLPAVDTTISIEELEKAREDTVIVVLDDDPTGTQTVHDIYILTEWSQNQIEDAFREHVFYISTNSRSLTSDAAYQLVHEVCNNVRIVAKKLNKSYLIITRGDSTLRGHFEPETKAASEAIGYSDAITVFVPAFFEGGRYTIDNIHYLEENNMLIPVSKTPFAQDKSFRYSSSNLYVYVLEKSKRIRSRDDIADLSIKDIRQSTIDEIAEKICLYRGKKVLIVNAADQADLRKVSVGLFKARNRGVQMIIRSGASMVSAIAGISDKPLLQAKDLKIKDSSGLIVIGSYVPKSTSQLEVLLKKHAVSAFELDVYSLLQANNHKPVIDIAEKLNEALESGRDCVLFTSRKLLSEGDSNSNLTIGKKISQGITQILSAIQVPPSFIITKGGITSSDVATRCLGIKKALVLGQIHAGVPVWALGPETKYPGMPLIIFPGNVGTDDSLSQVYSIIRSNITAKE